MLPPDAIHEQTPDESEEGLRSCEHLAQQSRQQHVPPKILGSENHEVGEKKYFQRQEADRCCQNGTHNSH